MPKLPSLMDLILNPEAKHKLTTPQIVEYTRQILALLPQKPKVTIPDDPASFAYMLSKGKWAHAPHLDVLSKKLAAAVRGDNPFLMVSMPPRHGKSELISFWTPLWYLAKYPDRKVILTSYEAEFAASWGARVRDAVIEHGAEIGLNLSESTAARDNWLLTTGGGMRTAGANGPITGKGAHLLISDDPIKNDEEANSEVMRDKLWTWFGGTFLSRREPGAAMVVVATRWHEDDLLGRLEKAATPDDDGQVPGLPFDILKFPAIAEEDDILGRKRGDALWPARYNENDLALIRKGQSPYQWGALYQQRPSPEEGGGVKRAWWKFYKVPPAQFDQVIQSWDLGFKDLVDNDFSVGQVWGRKGAEFFLLAQARDHMNSVDMIQAVRAMTSRFPQARAKLIESAANGPAVISMLQREISGMIPIKAKGTKDARLQAVIPLIEAGNVYLPENPDGTKPKWVWEFVEECAAFPNGTNDDQLDAMVHGLNYLMPQGWLSINRDFSEASRAPEPQTPLDVQKQRFSKWYRKTIRKSTNQLNQSQRLRNRLW